jgi:hypothetical protein
MATLFCLALAGWLPCSSSTGSMAPITGGYTYGSTHSTSKQLKLRCLHCRKESFVYIIKNSVDTATTDESSEPQQKRHKFSETFPMDPTSDHQLYCPWVTIVPNDSHLGWQVCLRAVVLSLEKANLSSNDTTDNPRELLNRVEITNSDSTMVSTTSVLQRIPKTLERVKSLLQS